MTTIRELAAELGVPRYDIYNFLYKTRNNVVGRKVSVRVEFDEPNANIIREYIRRIKHDGTKRINPETKEVKYGRGE